jgi:hypothetical protein
MINRRKQHSAGQGIVATENLGTSYVRQIFFQVDPADLDYIDHKDFRESMPSGRHLEFDPTPLLKYLPALEAEIFWLVFDRGKCQKDIAVLLGLSQPTVSYRFRRTLDKLRYLLILEPLDLKKLLDEILFLKPKERDILYDLFFLVNQELVGKKHTVRQSSVKWIMTKTKRALERMERENPEIWSHHLGALILLERNLGVRVML